jgi:hypothetical protein
MMFLSVGWVHIILSGGFLMCWVGTYSHLLGKKEPSVVVLVSRLLDS